MSGQQLSDDRIRHLEFLQGAIARMAGASAAIKNLCLVVVAGALAFVATSKEPALALYAAALAAVFWFLDARYLQQEKWFRDMYDAERARDPAEPASFVMTPTQAIRSAASIGYGLKSWSTWGLYAPLIAFLLIVWFLVQSSAGGCSNG